MKKLVLIITLLSTSCGGGFTLESSGARLEMREVPNQQPKVANFVCVDYKSLDECLPLLKGFDGSNGLNGSNGSPGSMGPQGTAGKDGSPAVLPTSTPKPCNERRNCNHNKGD